MSALGMKALDIMSRNSLWIRVLASSSVMEQEVCVKLLALTTEPALL
jgi:hypothetical protein